jgi:Kelch motif
MGPLLPQPVGEASVVSTGQSLFVLGGMSPKRAVLNTVYRLDDPGGKWVLVGHLPQARASGAAAFDGTRLVYAGGVDTEQVSHSQVFAMQGNAWHELPALPAPRNNFAAASDGAGTVWFFGGSQGGGDRTRTIFRLKGASMSSETTTLAFGVRTPAAVGWPGAGVCVIGGDGNLTGLVSCVDAPPKAGWVPPKVPIPRGGLAAAVVADRVYVVGGYFGSSQDSTVAESIRVR